MTKTTLPRGLTMADHISCLAWDTDQYYAGTGQRLKKAALGRFTIEDDLWADGRTTVIYAQTAMRRAAQRSIRAGGGVRGLCSADLRPGEARKIRYDFTIAEALAAGRGLR